jgi:ankyrin repeat protein
MNNQTTNPNCSNTNLPSLFLSEKQSIELIDALTSDDLEFFLQYKDLLLYPYLYFPLHFSQQLPALLYRTPLIFVIAAIGSDRITDLILSNCSDLRLPNDEHRGISHFLALSNNVSLFTKYVLPDYFLQRNDSGLTPLHYCCIYNSLSILVFLINHGIDLNLIANLSDQYNIYDIRPIHLAALYGHLELLKILIANGAIITATTQEGFNALHFAIASNSLSIIEFLFPNVLSNCHTVQIDYENYFQHLLFLPSLHIINFLDNNNIFSESEFESMFVFVSKYDRIDIIKFLLSKIIIIHHQIIITSIGF